LFYRWQVIYRQLIDEEFPSVGVRLTLGWWLAGDRRGRYPESSALRAGVIPPDSIGSPPARVAGPPPFGGLVATVGSASRPNLPEREPIALVFPFKNGGCPIVHLQPGCADDGDQLPALCRGTASALYLPEGVVDVPNHWGDTSKSTPPFSDGWWVVA